MSKSQNFPGTKFPASVVREAVSKVEQRARDLAVDAVARLFPDEPRIDPPQEPIRWSTMSVRRGQSEWGFNSLADFMSEFGSDLEKDGANLAGWSSNVGVDVQFSLLESPSGTRVTVGATSRPLVQELIQPFEEWADRHPQIAPKAPPIRPRLFIGHGGASSDWLVLQHALQNQHHYDVEAFETGARTGHTVRDVLEGALARASMALIIHSAADQASDDTSRARQNVVHEAGLFQGRLGFSRALILVEDGVQLYSNLDGIQHIKYTAGQIGATVGEILAVIRREFPD